MAVSSPVAPFLWGQGGAMLSPEQIARDREIAAALMQGGVDYSPVDHWLQGAARAAQAGVGALKDRWADEAEATGRAGFQSRWDDVFGSGQTASVDPVAQALAGTPQVPAGDTASYIRQGLVSRGLPEHVADAFLMNMQDESGLNPGINEANPTVPGSRGGYGLYQLTGPRRVAYEQYAQQLGVDPANVDAQLDFLMSELQGPEAQAYQSIMAAPDAGSAAAAIVNDFLRPAEEHRARRAAAYTGGAAPQMAQAQTPDIASLLGLASDPWANDTQRSIINALVGQQLEQQAQANDPLRQLQIQAAERDLSAPIEVGGVLLDPNTFEPIFDSRAPKSPGLINAGDGKIYNPSTGEWITAPADAEADMTDTQRNLAWRAEQAGLVQGTPEYAEFMRSGGQSTGMALSVGPDGTVSFAQGAGAAGKPLTENQSKLTLFQSLQTETQPVLLDLETQFDPSNIQDAAARSTPIAGNFFQSEQGQIYNSAATAWAEGALRIATGAAATPEEMERTKRAYFAQPGDTPNTIAFKAQMREMYNRAIQRSLGQEASGALPKPSDFAQQVGNGSGTGTTSTGLKWSIVP